MRPLSGAVPNPQPRFSFRAFGLELVSDFPLPGAAPVVAAGPVADVILHQVPRSALDGLADELRYMRLLHSYEGCGFAILQAPQGDVLFHYRERALFHLSADHTLLRCAISQRSGTAWQRVLLDTVLWTVSLLRRHELLHASAVLTSAGLVALVGRTGVGKTTLAYDLISRGGVLFCDDIVALTLRDGHAVAHPGPPLMTLSNELDPVAIGAEVLADLGRERWVAVPRGPLGPESVAAVVLLLRTASEIECARLAATTLEILPHLVSLAHPPERRRAQFEVAGAVVDDAAVLTLSTPQLADPTVATEALVSHLDLGSAGVAPRGRL